MCEYCEFKEGEDCVDVYTSSFSNRKEIILNVSYGPYTTLQFVKKEGLFFIRAEGEGTAENEIKYCPMCGKKLFDDPEDHWKNLKKEKPELGKLLS